MLLARAVSPARAFRSVLITVGYYVTLFNFMGLQYFLSNVCRRGWKHPNHRERLAKLSQSEQLLSMNCVLKGIN